VADTDREAYRLYKEPAEYFFNRSLMCTQVCRPPRLSHGGIRPGALQSQVRAGRAKRPTRSDMGRDGGEGLRRHQQPRHRTGTLEDVAKTFNCGHLLTMLQFGNMSDEPPGTTQAVRRGRRPGLRPVRRCRGPLVAGERSGGMSGNRLPPGIAGTAARRRSTPWRRRLERRRPRPPVRRAPGSGRPTTTWVARGVGARRTGALPCPVVGCWRHARGRSRRFRGGTASCCSPFGIFDESTPASPLRRADGERMGHLFAGVPVLIERFASSAEDGPVARTVGAAAASLLWPLGDRSPPAPPPTAPLVLWGELDELPVATSRRGPVRGPWRSSPAPVICSSGDHPTGRRPPGRVLASDR
jgi:hypothetical protein